MEEKEKNWSIQISPHRLWFVNVMDDIVLFTRYRPQARRMDFDEAVRLKETLTKNFGCSVVTICRNMPPLALVAD